jgi:hypothetical protein
VGGNDRESDAVKTEALVNVKKNQVKGIFETEQDKTSRKMKLLEKIELFEGHKESLDKLKDIIEKPLQNLEAE